MLTGQLGKAYSEHSPPGPSEGRPVAEAVHIVLQPAFFCLSGLFYILVLAAAVIGAFKGCHHFK